MRLTTGSIELSRVRIRAMGKIEEGMKWDPDYQALCRYASLVGISDPPARPISELAMRDARYVLYGGQSDAPPYVQGRVLCTSSTWITSGNQTQLGRSTGDRSSSRRPNAWQTRGWTDRDPDELQRLFFNSRRESLWPGTFSIRYQPGSGMLQAWIFATRTPTFGSWEP